MKFEPWLPMEEIDDHPGVIAQAIDRWRRAMKHPGYRIDRPWAIGAFRRGESVRAGKGAAEDFR